MPPKDTLPRVLGPFSATMLGVGAMIGVLAGVLVFFALLNISPLAWAISCLWIVSGAIVYWRMRQAE